MTDLSRAGFPVFSAKRDGNHVYWHLQPRRMPELAFPHYELVALLFLEHMADALAGTPFVDGFRAALRRITQSLSSPMRGYIRQVGKVYGPFVRARKSYEGSGQIIDDLNRALVEHKVCRVTYLTPGAKASKTYAIEPLRVFYYRGGLYLICRVPAHDQLITQAVERIKGLALTEEEFAPPEGSVVEERLSHSFGVYYEEPFDVAIWFSAAQAPYIRERVWHPSQRIEEQAGGSLILRMHVGGQIELKAWILSHGPEARVVEPESLREQVLADLRASLRRYRRH
jgi:predicted DNA-binding transcriptional regulator YafY